MEWVILAIVMLVMLPAAALPFLTSAQETMEKDVRQKQIAAAAKPVRQIGQLSANGPIEHRPAA
jgi:hypothetical protein